MTPVKPRDRGNAGNGVYPEAIGKLLGNTLAELGIEEKLMECQAMLAWEKVAKPPLDHHAKPLRMRRGQLELAVPSPIWRTQLSFLKEDMKKRINTSVGSDVVREIVLINSPIPPTPTESVR